MRKVLKRSAEDNPEHMIPNILSLIMPYILLGARLIFAGGFRYFAYTRYRAGIEKV